MQNLKLRLSKRLTVVSSLLWLNTVIALTPAQELTAKLAKIQTMQAHFVQMLYSDQGTLLQKTSGQMYLQHPGKFHWQTDKPKQILIADGHTLWVYDVELQQVTQQLLDEHQASSPAQLLSGKVTNLQQQFFISSQAESKQNQIYLLKPKKHNDMFQNVQLQFMHDQLYSLRFVDNLGQTSVFQFTSVHINLPLKSQLFHFTAPAGVDVVRQ